MTLTYLSVCSGIEAASVAWHTLGWRPVAFSEIDPFACAMLAARFPLVPNLGDMERYREWPIEPGAVDVLVGGTPCQSFSVAGLRKGLDDPRGNLALVYLGLVDRFRPRWIVWENVPGVLSADGGRAFGAFLGGLAQLGYGFAYRVLDAQYTRVDSHPRAVPQRRRRVFVVGCAGGDWRRAASVLLEPEGVRGDPPTRRASWEGAPRGPAAGARDGGVTGYAITAGDQKRPDRRDWVYVNDLGISLPLDQTGADPTRRQGGTLVGPRSAAGARDGGCADVSPTVAAKWSKGTGGPAGDEVQNLVPTVEPLPFDTTQITHPANRSQPQPGDPCHPLAREGHAPAVAFSCKDYGGDASVELAPTMRAMPHDGSHPNGGGQLAVAYGINSDAIDRSGEHKTGSAAARSGLGITCEVQPTLKARPTNSVAIAPAVFTLEVRGREGERVLEYRTDGTANALRTPNGGRDGLGVGAVAFKASHYTRGKDGAPAQVVPPLSADADKGDQDTLVAAVAFDAYNQTATGGVTHPLRVGTGNGYGDEIPQVLAAPLAVRRLTPRECERLQGFPDDWTLIAYRGKPASDGPRYKALGNSMATNVMRWIGLRIAAVEGGTHEVR